MDSIEPKKLALIRILQLLEHHSDHEHPLTHNDIIRLLDSEYGLVVERKAVGRNLSLLKEAGFSIESVRGGSYIDERDFTDAELHMLIDSVLCSYHIPKSFSKELIDKLCSLSSKYFRSHAKYIHTVNDWQKTDNRQLFLNIETIDDAIEKKLKIRFDYNKYQKDKKLHKTRSHTASPYSLILHNQRYYLMSRDDAIAGIVFFRLDRITGMQLTGEKAVPVTSVPGYENGIDYNKLSSSTPYMYTDTPEHVEFLADERIVDQVIDWFGNDIRISAAEDGRVRVSAHVSPNAMEHWATQYIKYVEVLSPLSLRERIRVSLNEGMEHYSDR